MSLSGIISGACAVLTATSAFDDTNVSWMDPGVIETTACRWAVMMTLEAANPERVTYGPTAKYDHNWGITMLGWVKYNTGPFSTWEEDNKTFPQDIVDAISGSDTLSGSCEEAAITLISVEAVMSKKRRYSQYTWVIEASEYDK